MQTEKILENVDNLQVKYLIAGANTYVDATAVPDWEAVVAVKVTITMGASENVDIAEALRKSTIVVNLRNH